MISTLINVRDVEDGWTALFHACAEGHLSMVKLLLEKEGIDPNSRDNDGYTPVTPLAHVCLDRGNEDIVCSLLSHPDTDPNAISNNGVSILPEVIATITPLDGGKIESLLRSAGATTVVEEI